MAKTAFVTGGTGFVGINLIKQLVEKGYEVTALFRNPKSKAPLAHLDITWAEGSITNKPSLLQAMPQNVDAVFHLAGSTNYWKKKYPEQYQTNVVGTQNMIAVALEKQAKRFVFTSSIAAFGIPSGPIDETSKSNAESCNQYYSYTKWQSQEDLKKAWRENGLEAVIVNPAHIVGPHDSHNWVEMFMQVNKGKVPAIPSGFGQYAHVKDIAAAHIAAAEKGRPGEQYILGGVDATFLEFINAIQKVMGKPLAKKETPDFVLQLAEKALRIASFFTGKQPLLTPDLVKLLIKDVRASSAKAEKELGFKTCSLEEQTTDTYKWLKAEGKL